MFFSPFEQFEIKILTPILVGKYDFSLTNLNVYLILTTITLLGIMFFVTRKLTVIPTPWQTLIESIYTFVLNLIIEQTGVKGRIFFPALFSIFWVILLLNLLGLTPFGFTATGHIIVTTTLSISFFIAWIIVGIVNLKFQFLRIFLPRGIPNWLIPLLVIIEILSFLIRPLSLAIRLFANMLAGHILLFIIATASLVLAKSFVLSGLLPFSFILAFIVLEIGIAFLQAYVFTILLCIYLSDSFRAH
jgi:F-type H+-transporting ATPase subunit a